MKSRNQSHELIMHSVYIALTYIDMKEEFDIPSIMSGVFNCPFEEIDIFAREVVIKTVVHMNDIIPVIESHLVKWKFARLARISQAILLMSYAHYKYVKGVDKAVVIDVAVRLAKLYLDDGDYRFINGVLDNAL